MIKQRISDPQKKCQGHMFSYKKETELKFFLNKRRYTFMATFCFCFFLVFFYLCHTFYYNSHLKLRFCFTSSLETQINNVYSVSSTDFAFNNIFHEWSGRILSDVSHM
jgi:hypothetical protein